MRGGLTYKDMDYRKACVAAVEDAADYIEGRCDNEKLAHVQSILRRALALKPDTRKTTGGGK